MKLLSGAFGSWRPSAVLSPRIETGRLVLRPLEPDDAEAVAVYLGDVEVARWLVRVPHPFTVEDAADFIGQCCATAGLGTATTLGLVQCAATTAASCVASSLCIASTPDRKLASGSAVPFGATD